MIFPSLSLGPNSSRRRQTAKQFFDGFDQWDIEALCPSEHQTVVMTYFRVSHQYNWVISSQGPSIKNHAKILISSLFHDICGLIQNFKPTIQDLLENKEANKISMWAFSTRDSVIGPYANEQMPILSFDETGEKVSHVLEFVDSKSSTGYFGWLNSHAQAKERPECLGLNEKKSLIVARAW